MDEAMRRAVKERAGHSCEYCRMPEAFYQTRFEIDHIIAQQHEGPTVLSNLALSCLHCNGHKGPNLTGIDPRTKKPTLYFIRGDTNGHGTSAGTAPSSLA